jgi:ribosomal protein L37E
MKDGSLSLRKEELVMENKKCSYCGSNEVSIRNEVLELSEPFSKTSSVTIKKVVCTTCGFEKEDESNDLVIQEELAILKRSSMVSILTFLNEQGHSNASMERALGLPARTLARWKNETSITPSASGLALMRIIRTFPWMLQVADCQFDQEKAQEILMHTKLSKVDG